MTNARDKANIPVLNFQSKGIDDNATSTAITIDSSERVGIGTSSPSFGIELSGSGNNSYLRTVRTSGKSATFGADASSAFIEAVGSTPLIIYTNSSERMRIDSSGNVGIAISSPEQKLDVNGIAQIKTATSGTRRLRIKDSVTSEYFDIGVAISSSQPNLTFSDGASERMRIDSSGKIGIGTIDPKTPLHITKSSLTGFVSRTSSTLTLENSGGTEIYLASADSSYGQIRFGDDASTYSGGIQYEHNHDHMLFQVNSAERMRIDSSGNLLVGTTSNDKDSTGASLRQAGDGYFTRNDTPLYLNRLSSDGEILRLSKNGTSVGYASTIGGTDIFFGSGDTGLRYRAAQDDIRPSNGSADRDNAIDLGDAAARFDDIFATSGTVNASDQNEKQSIQSLTTTEMNVGKKLSSLIKTFKWNSSVEEKGDNARTHTGLIAQQVKQAFDNESLDASKYGLWCSDTWYVDANGEEVTEDTEGAISKTRLGLRYSELFSFIQAYNDQRFTELEARITTLEANNP